MNRRNFIKSGAAVAATLGVANFFRQPQVEILLAGETAIELVEVRNGGPQANIRKAIELLGGISNFVSNGHTVLVKPNMAWDRNPEQAANTNPQLMAEIVKMCFEAGAKKVQVLDRSCHEPRRAYRHSGIEKACKDVGAEVRFIHKSRFEKIEIPKGELINSWTFYRDALEADVLINVPVAKHHSISRLTLGFKNIMGLIGGDRGDIHNKFSTKIVDINLVLKPQLTIIDATRVLLRNGPTGGNLADVELKNTVIAGIDRVAVDARATTLLDIDPSEVEYLRIAANRGLGQIDLNKVPTKVVDLGATG
jgi:uncharacterized protein (DUF362 family)